MIPNKNRKKIFEALFSMLPAISRSFSYIILKLKNQEIKDILCTSYMLFRIADTIEDADCPRDLKKELFSLFGSLMTDQNSYESNTMDKFLQLSLILENISTDEEGLITTTPIVLKGFYYIDVPIRMIIIKWIYEMIKGMNLYLEKNINNFADLDDYCYYVAGTVGFMLSSIFEKYNVLISPVNKIEAEILNFALLLQKVNVLRDIYDDRVKNRFFWPLELFPDFDRKADGLNNTEKTDLIHRMIGNIIPNIQTGYHYVLHLSKSDPSIRFFCIFSIILALKTISLIQRHPYVFEMNIKVSKSGFFHTLVLSHLASHSDMIYKRIMEKHLKKIKQITGTKLLETS